MKKISLSNIIQLILGIAVIILYILFFNRDTPKADEVQSTAPSSASSSIVYINSDTLWEKYEMVKKVTAELEKEQENMETQFAAKYKALEKEFISFQENAPLMSQKGGEALQKELMEKEQKLMDYKEKLASNLLELKQKKNEELQDKILDYIRRYNADHGFTYILGKSNGGGILFANDSLDITSDIVNGLNKEYSESTQKE